MQTKVKQTFSCDKTQLQFIYAFTIDAVHHMPIHHIGPDCNEQVSHVIEAVLGALRHRRGYV